MNVAVILIALPLLGAVIGYTTKWVSVQLLFRPARWVGIGPLGWQGVVQKRSPKFAAGIAQMLTTVVPVEEVVAQVDRRRLAAVLVDDLRPQLKGLGPVVVDAIRPGAWGEAAPGVQAMISTTVEQEAGGALEELADLVVPGLADIDITPLVVRSLSGENADRLADLVRTVAAEELRTVIRYGAVVGLLIGIVEAGLFLTFERWWLLPLVGALDGMMNNHMGIQMIFRPLEPTRYLGLVRYQGLVPARQGDIAADYSRMIARDVLSVPALVEHLAQDAPHLAADSLSLLRARLSGPVELMSSMVGSPADERRVDSVLDAVLDHLGIDPGDPVAALAGLPQVAEQLERELDLAATLERRLGALPKDDFEQILRGIFTEDERTLIVIGGVIGGVIGCAQAAVALAL